MNILLQSLLLLLVGINLIAARYVHWGSDPLRPFEHELFHSPYSQYHHGVGDYRHIFDDYSEEEEISKEPVISETSDELEAKQLKELESFLSTFLSASDDVDDDNVDERKIAVASKEIRNEKDNDNKSDNDDDKDDKGDKSEEDNDDKSDKDEKNDDDKSDNNDDKNDNDDDDNNNDNDDNDTKEDKEEEAEIADNSNEKNPIKPIVTIDESLLLVDDNDDDDNDDDDNDDDDNDDDVGKDDDDDDDVETIHVEPITVARAPLEKNELSEKEIRELTAFLVTLSTMEDLLKAAEHIDDEDNSKDAEELFEQKLKEVDNFMGLFVNTLDALLEESSEVGKDTKKSENDDDNDKEDKDDSKDDNDKDDDKDDDDDKKETKTSVEDNNNEDASISMEFHSVDKQTNTQNMDTHKYNLIERSTTATAHDFKPTSSPYTPASYLPAVNPNAAIIQEYVEEREQLDELQENLLTNKLNMDKDFYHIIANDGDDKEIDKFGKDIAAMRTNIFKMKQSIYAIQDIKSKLYFHQLIKSGLKDALVN